MVILISLSSTLLGSSAKGVLASASSIDFFFNSITVFILPLNNFCSSMLLVSS